MNTCTGLNKIKPQVRALTPYTLKRHEHDVKIDQNENPFDLPAEIKEEVLAFARERIWARYPDFAPEDLTEKLAEHLGWKATGVLVGNGSNELIQATLMVTSCPGARVVIPTPTFTVYRLMATVLGAEVVEVYLKNDYTFDVTALRDAARGADVLIVCSPNNPTGCVLSNEDLRTILEGTDALVVVDEAYHEFYGETCMGMMPEHRNLVVLRTFSKAFALAGLRVGCLAAHPEVAAEISKGKLPYNLNFFSQAAAMAALENTSALREQTEYIKAQRELVYRRLGEIEGVTVYPSHANFLLFETDLNPREVFDGLLRHGVLVRDVSRYPMLSKALRVSIGTEEENERFLEGLASVMRRA